MSKLIYTLAVFSSVGGTPKPFRTSILPKSMNG